MKGARKLAFGLITAAIPVGALLAGIQLALPRFVPMGAVTYHFWGNRPTTLLPGVEQHAVTAEYDVRLRPNSLGFNDREHAVEKPAGRLRVLLLGDSIVEGVQVRPDQHMARLVEARAARAGHDVEVIAMGASGQGESHQLANYVALGRARQPDVVFTYFCANDLWNNLEREARNGGRPIYVLDERGALSSTLEGRPEIPPTPAELAMHAHKESWRGFRALRRLLGASARLVAPDDDTRRAARAAALYDLPDDVGEADAELPGVRRDQRVMFEKLVAGLQDEVVDRDGHRLIAVLASGNLRRRPGRRYQQMIGWVEQTFAREGISTLDMEILLRPRAEAEGAQPTFEVDAHLNAQGHAWVAEILYEELQPLFGG
jgi:lysophospholipase L1-like esterase